MSTFDIGANIRRLRLGKSMTQEQLARALGLSPQAVSKWENGTTAPDIQLLPEISVLLGATIDELFSLTDDARMTRIDNMLYDVRFLPEDTFREAERYLTEKRADRAMRPRATLLLAQLYIKRGDEYRDLAKPLAREALELAPEVKDAHNAVFDAAGGPAIDWYGANHHELIEYYQAFTARHPKNRRNYLWLMDLLIADGRTEEAREAAERMRQVEHTYHYELYMGKICKAACDLPGALNWFRKMTEQYPEEWLVWAAYGDEMAWLCRYDEAIAAYERAVPLQPKPRYVDPQETLSDLYELTGDISAAIRMQEKIIELMREDWDETEGEAIDAHRREIERLRAKL